MSTPLNKQGYKYLKNRKKEIKNKNEFSIIFIGDSHNGYVGCPNASNENYLGMLAAIKHENKFNSEAACIIHGGDTAHYQAGLPNFVNNTENVLYKTKPKIPIFCNVGNHDYHNTANGNYSLSSYRSYVLYKEIKYGNSIVDLHAAGFNLAVVMINTGYRMDGHYPAGTTANFHGELVTIRSSMNSLLKNHPNMNFVIDMHIPPHVIYYPSSGTYHIGPQPNDVLNTAWNNDLKNVILKNAKLQPHLLAVVAHHRHAYYQSSSNVYWVDSQTPIPVYTTAQGGNCINNNLKSILEVKLVKSKGAYNLGHVSRYDYNTTAKLFGNKIPIK
ncbi:MAG: metallophosphoesterase [Solirubrobacterales bacterium]